MVPRIALFALQVAAIRSLREEADLELLQGLGGDFPELCSSEIVSETCGLLKVEGEVSEEIVAEAISKTKEQMSSLWMSLGIPEKVECMELCLAVTKYLKVHHVLPPFSDVACYTVGRRSYCDADLRASSLPLAGLGKEEDLKDFHDNSGRDAQDASADDWVDWAVENFFAVSNWHLLERVANLFRIYPAETPGDANAAIADAHFARIARKSEKLAQAFVSVAVREFQEENTGIQVSRWFGDNDLNSRRTVRATLNSIADALVNAWYIYPGQDCKNRYAYVHKAGHKCSDAELAAHDPHCSTYNGKYVIYLCKAFFDLPKEQIAVLVHEASHIATAYTEDVCVDLKVPVAKPTCKKAYGRRVCQDLALRSSERALSNADNYCYYVEDVVREVNAAGTRISLRRSLGGAEDCPKWSSLMGRHCRCRRSTRCRQAEAEDCPFGLRRSSSEFLPSCENCRCSGKKSSKKYEEHPECTEPCGSELGGVQLREDECAKCDTDKCNVKAVVKRCELRDPCKDTTCGQFSSCRSSRTAQGLKANCECHEHFERDAEGRCAADQKFFRCCASQGESVWYGPKDLDQRLFPFPKKICPKGHRKWSHASNCTDLVFGINYT